MVGPDAKHGMPIKTLPTAGAGQHCKLPDPSFMVRCDYGAAELLLSHIYPDSSAAPAPVSGDRLSGFDQTEFFDERDKSTSLNEAGYLYVPEACENSSTSTVKCRLHVAFHGCEQYVDKIHDIFFRDAGYNAWAEANNVIVLYPQTTQWLRSALVDPTQISGNPKGCWDWWGYSGDGYYGQNGKQMRAVRAMIDRMLPK
jgi:poly(3-hydroxybutyrate) depolymerase